MTYPRFKTHLISLFMLLFCLQASATSVLPISMQRMAAAADIIFHGKVISNEVRLDPVSGNVATFTTFQVTEVVKGNAGTTHTIKQIGGQLPGSNVRQVIHGVPSFSAGMEYVVFLPKASSLGFASPIGLSQGKFDVLKLNGNSVIANKRAAAAVSDTAARQTPNELPTAFEAGPSADAGAVQLTDFLQGVRAMVKD